MCIFGHLISQNLCIFCSFHFTEFLYILVSILITGDDRGPVLEVIVSRTNFISSHTTKKVRVVGLSTALANARDLADWLGIKQVNYTYSAWFLCVCILFECIIWRELESYCLPTPSLYHGGADFPALLETTHAVRPTYMPLQQDQSTKPEVTELGVCVCS